MHSCQGMGSTRSNLSTHTRILQIYDVPRIEEAFTQELARLYRIYTPQSLREISEKEGEGLLLVADAVRLLTAVDQEVSFCPAHTCIPISESDPLTRLRYSFALYLYKSLRNRHKCKLQGKVFDPALFLQSACPYSPHGGKLLNTEEQHKTAYGISTNSQNGIGHFDRSILFIFEEMFLHRMIFRPQHNRGADASRETPPSSLSIATRQSTRDGSITSVSDTDCEYNLFDGSPQVSS